MVIDSGFSKRGDRGINPNLSSFGHLDFGFEIYL